MNGNNPVVGGHEFRTRKWPHRESNPRPSAQEGFDVLRDSKEKYFITIMSFDAIEDLVQHYKMFPVNKTKEIFLKDMYCTRAFAGADYKPKNEDELELRPSR
ncbi:hypothetical protein CAPTEDRAFT_188758 [Capitella teleta]|uniref:SH2 domain-containing protein n=1 Tax=Capitella teleta TaxID=283909 RepID=R7TKG3_CAPTE|nr:hypothetical protein CAPTEDRAFT_188758 [Capitella teleta]|eukprot:ELT91605.1 hypothetical protein CAPTEDRAFT_188758 [Capitella teleta]